MTILQDSPPLDAPPAPSPRRGEPAVRRGAGWGYRSAYWLGGALLAGAVLAVIVTVLTGSAAGISHWFSTGVWDPDNTQLSPGVLVLDTLLVTLVAMLLAVPVGLGTAIALSEVVPSRLAGFLASIIDLIAGVPSIVIGLWALIVLVPIFQRDVEPRLQHLPLLGSAIFGGPFYGTGILLASTLLAIMVLPTVASLSRSALLSVPRTDREAARALGATRWQATRRVLLPTARSGIGAAITLAVGRALGESIAVALVIGGSAPSVPHSLFDQGATLGSAIINQFAESTPGTGRSSVVALGAVLLLLTLAVNAAGRYLWGNGAKPWRSDPGQAPNLVTVGPAGGLPLLAAAADTSPAGASTLEASPPPAEAPEAGAPSPPVALGGDVGRPRPADVPPIITAADEHHSPADVARRTLARRLRAGHVLEAFCTLFVLVALAPLVAVFGYTLYKGARGVSWSFLTTPQNPLASNGGGISTAIAGTLKIVGLGVAMAVPVSLLGALFLFENKGRLANTLRTGTEVLAGVPSIVMGIFAYSVVVVPLHRSSIFAASVAVAFLMLPIMTRANEEAIRAVPHDLREAGAALGARRGRVMRSVVLRTSLPGLVSGNLLAVARSLGETAPLVLTLAAPTMAMTYTIYTDATQPFGANPTIAWATALCLLVGVLALSLVARGVAAHLTRKAR